MQKILLKLLSSVLGTKMYQQRKKNISKITLQTNTGALRAWRTRFKQRAVLSTAKQMKTTKNCAFIKKKKTGENVSNMYKLTLAQGSIQIKKM